MAKTAKWVALGALFIIPFIPLLIANSYFFPFITGKAFAFRILVEIAFFAWVVLACADKEYRPRFSWTGAIFAVFVLWMAFADALGVNPLKAFWSNFERMEGWVTLIHVFLFFVVSSSILSVDKLWKRWWYTFLGGSVLICLYGLLQIAGKLTIHQGGTRLDASFGNAAYIAAYFLFTIAISVWLAFEAKNRWWRYGLFALAALQFFLLMYTETRGAALGFLGAAFLASVLWMIGSGKRGRQGAAVLFVGLLVLVGGFVLVHNNAWVRSQPVLARLSSISLSEGQTRFTIWHMAFQGALERPITGWGQEGFNYVFNKYYEPSMYGQEAWFDRAHDVFLDWLIAGGVPALLLFLALLASATLALYRSEASRPQRILLIAALAAYCIQGIFVFDNLFTYIPLAAILAIAHGLSSRKIGKLDALPNVGTAALSSTVGPVALVAVLAVIWFVNVPGMKAAGDLIRGITPSSDPTQNLAAFKKAIADGSFANQEIREQLMIYASGVVGQSNVPNDVKSSVAEYALTQLAEEVKSKPNDARIRLEYATGFRAVGDYQDALTQIDAALAASPKKQQLFVEKGIDLWESGQLPAARDIFKQAYELDTNAAEMAAYAAAGDIATGNIVDGKKLLVEKFGTTTVDKQPVLLAYYQIKDYDDFIAVYRQRFLDSNTPDAQFQLASAYLIAGRYAEARTEVNALIAAYPDAAAQGAALLAKIPAGH